MTQIGPRDWVSQSIRDRGITRLCHFTSIRALERIAEDRALIDRQTLEDRDQGCAFNDPYRHDGQRHHVCFTLEHPNVWMMDMLSSRAPQKREFVILCISPSEMERDNVLFSPGNAATKYGDSLAPGEAGFNRLYLTITGPRAPSRRVNHARSCPTDLQAEVLIPGPIPLSSALCVVTASEENSGYVRHVLSANEVKLPVVVQPKFFSHSDITSAVWSGNVIELPGM